MKPISISKDDTNQLFYSDQVSKNCGNYYQNDTENSLYFLLTNNCTVYLKMKDSVKVNMRLKTDFKEFIKTKGLDNFIEKTASFLKIDKTRLMVTQCYSGSVVIDFYITPEDSAEESEAS